MSKCCQLRCHRFDFEHSRYALSCSNLQCVLSFTCSHQKNKGRVMLQKIDKSKKRVLGIRKKPEELRRTVSVSFSPNEMTELDKVAGTYELSRSEFLRCIVFGNIDSVLRKIELVQVSEHEKQRTRILASIANNLNQIARKLHQHVDGKHDLNEVVSLMERLKQVSNIGRAS